MNLLARMKDSYSSRSASVSWPLSALRASSSTRCAKAVSARKAMICRATSGVKQRLTGSTIRSSVAVVSIGAIIPNKIRWCGLGYFATGTQVLTMAILLTAAAGVPVAVHNIGHDQVSATMTKGGAIVEDPGLRILANRREAGAGKHTTSAK